jgi:hypothetical protein
MKLTIAAVLGSTALFAGCAPDAWSNKQATGFNAFLDTITVACAPLHVGPMIVTRNYYPPNYAQGQYDLWLDQTSRLYYQRITPETYLTNIGNFGPFPDTIKSAQCVVSQLSAATPPPPGTR